MLHRLRTDFHLSVITLLGVCASFGILPFAVYRFFTGNILTGTVDCAILISIMLAVIYAWRTGDTRRAGLFLATVTCSGGALVASLVGDAGLFWMYPTLLTSFFLAPPRYALMVDSLAVALLALHGAAFSSDVQMWSFLTTCMVVSACAFIFAQRTETQRIQLEKLANRDPLTGARNRRVMERELQLAVQSWRETGMSYGLIMLDLDHFKKINDQYGHNVGDQVLVDLARVIIDCTRRADHLFRFGGEEFVLLLAGADLAGLKAVASNLRHRIESELESPGGPVTASLGGAVLRADESWAQWVKRADTALYRAKAEGRNCVIIDRGEGTPPIMVESSQGVSSQA